MILLLNPAVLQRALQHPEGQEAALRKILSLSGPELQRTRAARLGSLLLAIALDEGAPHARRVQALRAMALLKSKGAAVALSPLLKGQSPEAISLARELARTWRRLKMKAPLSAAIGHIDPEVRAQAAALGAGGEKLCQLLKEDPWPMVRRAAAQGIKDPSCLKKAFKDGELEVVLAAIQRAGDLRDPSLLVSLEAIARDSKIPLPLRAMALNSLGALGQIKLAQAVLETHLKKGGLLDLSVGAIQGLSRDGSSPARTLLRAALDSPDLRIRNSAARALLQLSEKLSVERLMPRWGARERAAVEGMRPQDPDPADSDPE